MPNRAIATMAFLLPYLIFQSPFAQASQTDWEIPFKLGAKGIVVQGAIGKAGGLQFMVDTGSTTSFLDTKVVKRLRLGAESRQSRVLNLDTVAILKRVLVSDLRFGPISASIYFYDADLCDWGVDGIIGLDLLRHARSLTNSRTQEALEDNRLTFDFESRTIQFGRPEHLRYSVPIKNDSLQITVSARILDRPLSLVVDTAADLTSVFNKPDSVWIDRELPFVQSSALHTLDGDQRAREVQLPNLELGDCRWGWVRGLVINTRLQQADGLLAIHTLGLKILHFDFDRNIMSWNR